MANCTYDIAVVGHFAVDSILLPNCVAPLKVPGGAVTYVSSVVRLLGGTVTIVSRIGGDFPDEWLLNLGKRGIDTSAINKVLSETTTGYELKYGVDLSERALKLKSRGSPIELTDLPKSLRAKAIHVAPIDGEVPLEVVQRLRGCTDCLSIDPQGLTRRFNRKGDVSESADLDKRIISLADIYKSSSDEVKLITGESDVYQALKAVHELGPKTAIATSGSKGSILSIDGQQSHVPACKSRRVVDPTGAGDVFIGAYLIENIHNREPLWCACVGSAAASLVVEGMGSSFFGDKEEVYRRAREVYKNK